MYCTWNETPENIVFSNQFEDKTFKDYYSKFELKRVMNNHKIFRFEILHDFLASSTTILKEYDLQMKLWEKINNSLFYSKNNLIEIFVLNEKSIKGVDTTFFDCFVDFIVLSKNILIQ